MNFSLFILLNRNLATTPLDGDFFLLGGISLTLLGMFLYLVYDYTDRKKTTISRSTLKIDILKKSSPVLEEIIRKRVSELLHRHFQDESENFDLWLHRKDNRYIVYSSGSSIQKLQEFPERAVEEKLSSNLVVHFRDYYYFPVLSGDLYAGFFAVKIDGSPSRRKAAALLAKIEEALNDMEIIQSDLQGFTDETGLFSREILMENIESRFADEKRNHLCLMQLHGWDDENTLFRFSAALEKHMGKLPLFHYEQNIVACFLGSSAFSEFRLKAGEVHADSGMLDFSAGIVSSRDAGSDKEWLKMTVRLLRQACLEGANFIKYS